MTVKELSELEEFKVLTIPDPDRDIEGVYIGDLLSWVMGRAKANCAWITIMSNINVVAVSTLADVSLVILAEGVTLEDEVLSAATQKGVNVLSSSLPAYETALMLSGKV